MTYSIVGADTARDEVGGAGASCVGNLSLHDAIYNVAPGFGVMHSQALLGSPGRDDAVMAMMNGVAPADILAMITQQSFDSQAQSRQYGIVDLMGRSAGFTGSSTLAFADDRQGQVGAYTYSVQGNILTSSAVLDQAIAGFESTAGCDLADRLMRRRQRRRRQPVHRRRHSI
jgi:uncharacterized Ntn-hydrolase superfamily protein